MISLMGLIVLFAEPFVPLTMDRPGLDSAARRVRADLAYARELAILTGVNHGVSFVAGQPYVVYRQVTSSPVTDPVTRQAFSQNLSSSGNIGVANYQVEFDKTGRPVVGGGGSVTLSSLTGASRVVQVRANTGLLEIP